MNKDIDMQEENFKLRLKKKLEQQKKVFFLLKFANIPLIKSNRISFILYII